MRQPLQGYFLDQVDIKADPYVSTNWPTTVSACHSGKHVFYLRWKALYDSYHYSLASEMEIRRQKIACLDAILEKERYRHAEKMASFQKRWESAAEAMKAVDDSIVKFDDHYKVSFRARIMFFHLCPARN